MKFSIEELQFYNKHLDYRTALQLQYWLKLNLRKSYVLDDDIRDAIITAIKQDEVTYNPNKGSLLPYLKHSIEKQLITAYQKTLKTFKGGIKIPLEVSTYSEPQQWIDLSFFSDEELLTLYNSLVKGNGNFNKIKELLDGYSKQINTSK